MTAAMQPAEVPLVGAAWYMSPDSCPRFSMDTTRDLRRRGVRGARTVVVLTPDAIRLMGLEGGEHLLPLARVAGLRAGVLRAERYRQAELRLRLLDPADTLVLLPLAEPADVVASGRGYAGFVRGLAADLAARGRADGVETGTSLGWAITCAVLMGCVTATMVGMFAWTLVTPLPDVERLVAPALTGAIALGMVAGAVGWWWTHWPLRVRRPADLERMLTP
jgi:hypothetical protein